MIDIPHHDGSELYVSDPTPLAGRHGRRVSSACHARLRRPGRTRTDDARRRSVLRRGRPSIARTAHEGVVGGRPMRIANPDTHYRFLLGPRLRAATRGSTRPAHPRRANPARRSRTFRLDHLRRGAIVDRRRRHVPDLSRSVSRHRASIARLPDWGRGRRLVPGIRWRPPVP